MKMVTAKMIQMLRSFEKAWSEKKEAMYYLQDVPNLYFPAFQPPNVTQFEQHFCKSL